MPISKVELTGGAFQDSQGNVLALGYLKMRLSADEEVNSSMICSGIELTINLDASGNVIAGQFVWGNDQLLPVNSFYIVTGYTAKGQPAWGPNNQQALGNGGTFDVGTWVPNLVINWTPPLQPISLEVNGVPASSQTLQNFVNSATITFVDNGNGDITANGVAPVTPGFALNANNWFTSNQDFSGILPDATDSVFFNGSEQGGCPAVQVRLITPVTVRKISTYITVSSSTHYVVCAVYSADGQTKLIDAGFKAFDASTTGVKTVTLGVPITLPAGNYLVAWSSDITNTIRGVGRDRSEFSIAFMALMNANAFRIVTGTDNENAGNMPSALGTVAPVTVQDIDLPTFLFE